MKGVFAMLALLLWLGSTNTARAQDVREKAERYFRSGAAAYTAGDYATAIQAFEEALELTALPAIQFSLAQAERKQYFATNDAWHLGRAIDLYRRYLADVPAGGRRADAVQALEQLEPLTRSIPEEAPAEGQRERGRTRVMVTAAAPGARLSLDGAPAVSSPLIREVAPGEHHIRVSAPGYVPVERVLIAVAGALIPTEVALAPKPCRLSLRAPEGADVLIDGVLATREQRSGRASFVSCGTHVVAAHRRGYVVAKVRFDLQLGESRSLTFSLRERTERKTAKVLFIASAGAFAGGMLVSALGVRAENRAEAFLGSRSARNVTTSELAGYRDAEYDRDRFRIASGITFGASAVLLGVGAFLFQHDPVDASDLR